MALLGRIVCSMVLAFALAGCAATRPSEVSWQDPGVDLVWPKPPETPRIRFLRTIEPADFVGQGRGRQLFRWISGEKEQVFPLVTPYGIAADGQGRVWVADTGLRVIHAFNLARQEVTYVTAAGTEPLLSPVGVAFDSRHRRLYVSDSKMGKVFVFDETGGFLGERMPPGGYKRPGGLATDVVGNLYVVDVIAGAVEVFSPDGVHLKSLRSVSAPEGFSRPSNVAVGMDGRVYVTDSLHFRVEILDAAGESLGTIGQVGDVPGTFARPRGVAVDSAGQIYVADAAFDNVQIFDAAGRLLLYFGESGKEASQFSLPAGILFDSADRLYVVDVHNHRIQIFQYLPQGAQSH